MTRLVWTLPDGQQTARWAEDTGGSQTILSATTNISAAQLLASNTTAITVVAAPGVGQALFPLGMVGNFTAGGTPYTDGSDLDLIYAGQEADDNAPFGWTFEAFAIDNPDSDCILLATQPSDPQKRIVLAAAENKALKLHMESGDPSDGDGTLVVTVYYAVVDV